MPKGIKGFQKGHKSGMTGKHHSEESKKKIGVLNSARMKGYKMPQKVRLKISQTTKGRKPHPNWLETQKKAWQSNRNKTHTKEHNQKIREAHIKNPFKKFKETGIELKIENELKFRKINYQKQVPLCKIAIVDFYLPEYRIVIQCDGCFWHGCEIHKSKWADKMKKKNRDKEQDRVLAFNGFNVYRFWEHEINESPKNCINKIIIQDDIY